MLNKCRVALFCLFLGLTYQSASADSFSIDNIRIEGLQRVSAEIAFANLPLKIGDQADAQSLANATKQLFRSGYFEDISLIRDGDELVVQLVERPAIAGIVISGNKLIPTEALEQALTDAKLAEGEIFQSSTLAAIELAVEREYNGLGRYAVVVSTELNTLEENRVELVVAINEGINSTITHINIVGNQVYSESELLSKMQLQTDNFWSLFTKDSQYSREKLAADLESIRAFYLDSGYVLFTVESTQVSVSPDQTQVFITINISEGDVFNVGQVKVAGTTPVAEAQIKALANTLEGKVFSRQQLIQTAGSIEQLFGNGGFVFADVDFTPTINKDDQTVDIEFSLRPGKRTYVRRITFTGNTITSDQVLRREMRLLEGSVASFEAIQASRLRLQRLGLFNEVSITTQPVFGSDDLLDINIQVTEGLTANWSAKLGYVDGEGAFWGGSIAERNFLGSGNTVELSFTSSVSTQKFNFSYLNPYYTVDGVSLGFDVYYIARNFANLKVTTFATDRAGADVKLGYPLSENSSINMKLGTEKVDLTVGSSPTTELNTFVNQEGKNYRQWYADIGWNENTLNDYWYPTAGRSHGINLEVALPNSDLHYYRTNYNYRYFKPLDSSAKYVFSLGAQLGYAATYGNTQTMPPFENYYAGGYGSVRGFDFNSLGPLSNDGTSMGGQILTTATTELIVPLFDDLPSVRTVLFLDVGNTFSTGEFTSSQLRSSAGLSLAWLTPVGPLTFVAAVPVRTFDGDKLTRTHITLGRSY